MEDVKETIDAEILKNSNDIGGLSGEITFWLLVIFFSVSNLYYISFSMLDFISREKEIIGIFNQFNNCYWLLLFLYASHNSVNKNKKKRCGEKIVVATMVVSIVLTILRLLTIACPEICPDFLQVHRISNVMFDNFIIVLLTFAYSKALPAFSGKFLPWIKGPLSQFVEKAKKSKINISFNISENRKKA